MPRTVYGGKRDVLSVRNKHEDLQGQNRIDEGKAREGCGSGEGGGPEREEHMRICRYRRTFLTCRDKRIFRCVQVPDRRAQSDGS